MTGHFLAICPDDCRRLLAAATVGRVGWASSAGVQIIPVNVFLHGDALYVRVDPASILAELAADTGIEAAIEVDDVDPETATGWSVLAQGRATRHDGPAPDAALRPWAPGERKLLVRLDIASLSGRSVSAPIP